MANPSLQIDVDLDTDRAERDARKNLSRAGRGAGAGFAAAFSRNLGAITTALVGVAAVAKSIDFFRDSIRAAAVQQQAINDLNTQLSITGQFTQAVSQDLQDFASQLQSTSRFGDEAILSQLAFAQALGATAEQSKDIVAAGADLAESLNIDLNSAVRNVGRTLGGFAGELGEVIPELKALTTEQLQAGAAIDLIAQKFAGAAQGRIRTFAGATAQLSNTFGDFQEAIGRVVTNSPAFIGVINTTTKLIEGLSQRLLGLSADDPFAELIQGLVTFGRGASLLIKPFEVFFNFIKAGFSALRAGIATIFEGIVIAFQKSVGPLLESLSRIPGKIGKQFAALSNDINTFRVAVSATADDESFAAFENLANVFETSNADESFRALLSNYQAAIDKSREFKKEITNGLTGGGEDEEGTPLEDTAISFTNFSAQVSAGLESLAKTAVVTGKTVAKALVGGIANAASSAFSAFGAALVNGENALAAFGDALLAAFGNALIQQGTGFILQGIAQSIAGFGSGAPLIAAGAAMATFGGALTALGGGSAGVTSTGAGAVAPGIGVNPNQDQFSQTNIEEREEPQTRVAINIRGDVLDSDETGIRIAKILEEASLNENVRVVGGLA